MGQSPGWEVRPAGTEQPNASWAVFLAPLELGHLRKGGRGGGGALSGEAPEAQGDGEARVPRVGWAGRWPPLQRWEATPQDAAGIPRGALRGSGHDARRAGSASAARGALGLRRSGAPRLAVLWSLGTSFGVFQEEGVEGAQAESVWDPRG